MADQQDDQMFVEYTVKSIVNHPDDVRTERTVDERGVLITLFTNPEDMGYVIGRQGQTARALRTLLRIVGAKHNARVNLKIFEPEGSRRERPMREGSAYTPTAPGESSPENLDDIDLTVPPMQS